MGLREGGGGSRRRLGPQQPPARLTDSAPSREASYYADAAPSPSAALKCTVRCFSFFPRPRSGPYLAF
jgi:hypothetical protein